MAIRVLVLLIVSFSINAAEKEYGNVIVQEVTSIYDADTFRVNIADWPDIVGKHVSIRVLGVDAPELRGKCKSEKIAARKAKQHTVELLRSGKTIELRNMKRGKYFRILADVYIDGNSLAESLINNDLARSYDGGTRLGWCADDQLNSQPTADGEIFILSRERIKLTGENGAQRNYRPVKRLVS